jgi:hypothetical protein
VGEKKSENFQEICCTNLATWLITMGMKKEKALHELSASEAKLIEGLRLRPDMMERMQSILEIASNQEGPLKRADEVEELLIEEMRRLGHSTMSQWATQAEERVSTELKGQDPTVLSRKKKR